MPRFTSTDKRSWIEWEWDSEPSCTIRPESLKWSLAPERAGPMLMEILTKNDDIYISGGHWVEDLRPFYEGIVLGLEELRVAFPSVVFRLPGMTIDLPEGAIG